jgi:hypothetical protein
MEEMKGLLLSGIMGLVDIFCDQIVYFRDRLIIGVYPYSTSREIPV